MQKIYWNKLTQRKYALCYFNAHFSRCVKIDRSIKIFCAIASSSAIAAWVAWQNLNFWWGLIIVTSQVVTAVNEILPYKKRIQELSDLRSELTPIYNNMEKSWHDVANGSLTEDEINELCYYYIEQWNQIDDKYFKSDALPEITKCEKIAENEKNIYFKNYF